jgi:hypothetical protein
MYEGVWSVPSRVAEMLGVALVESVPPAIVAVAVTFEPSAAAARTSPARAAAPTATVSLRATCYGPLTLATVTVLV